MGCPQAPSTAAAEMNAQLLLGCSDSALCCLLEVTGIWHRFIPGRRAETSQHRCRCRQKEAQCPVRSGLVEEGLEVGRGQMKFISFQKVAGSEPSVWILSCPPIPQHVNSRPAGNLKLSLLQGRPLALSISGITSWSFQTLPARRKMGELRTYYQLNPEASSL